MYSSIEHKFAQLDAPGVADAIAVTNKLDHTFAIVVAAIDTDVVVRMEGSLDGVNFGNMDSDQTIDANGTTLLSVVGLVAWIRPRFVSEDASPSAATVDVTYMGRS